MRAVVPVPAAGRFRGDQCIADPAGETVGTRGMLVADRSYLFLHFGDIFMPLLLFAQIRGFIAGISCFGIEVQIALPVLIRNFTVPDRGFNGTAGFALVTAVTELTAAKVLFDIRKALLQPFADIPHA